MQDWSAEKYLLFEEERTRPARDLAQAIKIDNPKKIIDIGCGPGNSTETLANIWPNAHITGFDSSPNMIKMAKQRLPHIQFTLQDIYQWQVPANTDILFSNAVFQWLPDHIKIMQNIIKQMQKGAVLAVQMPDNLLEPNHKAMIEVAQTPEWQERIGTVARKKLADIRVFYDAFKPYAQTVDIWHSIYNHVMPNHQAIIEWLQSTGLRPFVTKLSEEEKKKYINLYLKKIKEYYQPQSNGEILLAFPRLFIIVVK